MGSENRIAAFFAAWDGPAWPADASVEPATEPQPRARPAKASAPRARKRDTLLGTLAAQFRGSIAAGAAWSGEIAEGDLVAEVTVRIRRRVTHAAAHDFREEAYAALRKEPGRVRHCACWVTRRSSWGGSHEDRCSGRVVAAVAYTATFQRETAFQFVCSRHRDKSGIRAEYVLAVVELFESALRPIREQDKANEAKWRAEQDAKWRSEDESREAARRAGKAEA